MQKILGQVFKAIIQNDREDLDLKERAVYYYKTISSKPQNLMNIVY